MQFVDRCTRLHLSFEALAPQFPFVHFARCRASDVFANYSEAGLPTLIAYRAGEQVYAAVRCTDILGEKFSDLDVCKLLQRSVPPNDKKTHLCLFSLVSHSKSILQIPKSALELDKRRQQRMQSKFADEINRELDELDIQDLRFDGSLQREVDEMRATQPPTAPDEPEPEPSLSGRAIALFESAWKKVSGIL